MSSPCTHKGESGILPSFIQLFVFSFILSSRFSYPARKSRSYHSTQSPPPPPPPAPREKKMHILTALHSCRTFIEAGLINPLEQACRTLVGPRHPKSSISTFGSILRRWKFPKVGDPNMVPQRVGSYYKDPKTRYPDFRKLPGSFRLSEVAGFRRGFTV